MLYRPRSAFLICDHEARPLWARCSSLSRDGSAPYLKSGYLKRGPSVAELAERCGIDAEILRRQSTALTGLPLKGPIPISARALLPTRPLSVIRTTSRTPV